jgi:hypothetical protein
MVEAGNSRCWKCGSTPKASLSSDKLSTVNERLRDISADDSFEVKKGQEPRDRPVESPLLPQDDDDSSSVGADDPEEDTSHDHEISPIWSKIGNTIAWIDKWWRLTNTHLKSIMIVVSVTTIVWGISVIYGAVRFGHSGLIALIGASIFAIIAGGAATLTYLAPGRGKTIALAYPFGLTMLFLPPTVIGLYEPTFSSILGYSTDFANFVANTFLNPIGLEQVFRETFELEGGAYLLMWTAVSFPVGWLIGLTQLGSQYIVDQLTEKADQTPPTYDTAGTETADE